MYVDTKENYTKPTGLIGNTPSLICGKMPCAKIKYYKNIDKLQNVFFLLSVFLRNLNPENDKTNNKKSRIFDIECLKYPFFYISPIS